jgi:hypothetical protein
MTSATGEDPGKKGTQKALFYLAHSVTFAPNKFDKRNENKIFGRATDFSPGDRHIMRTNEKLIT